ncbi:unnamed protein product [Diatraea saccharalis]|uniref:Glucose-methanol-choline oxidoreductase N-terminal domain-containing protein n=1 Tax=Diatraea saccharalis TaxID=40085 RepID=A0A9N9R809_9NEOP|nr:unnamed protein product [Diatraea saccharalis]
MVILIILSVECKNNGINQRVKNRISDSDNRNSLLQNPLLEHMQSVGLGSMTRSPNDLFDILRDSYPLPNGLNAPFAEYDYVIVGAGTAGSVLASRLSEDPEVTVLVLEVGRPESLITDVPAIAPFFQRTEYSWPYYMEPQSGVCLGMRNRRCYWPRGRAVGGTSVINYMIYTRGRPEEWDRIAAAGNYGWSYRDVLEYYKKSERADLRGFENSPYRGKTGEMNVEFVPFRTPLISTFLEAGRILGYPTVDYNAPERLGFGYLQANMRNGKRVSAAKAFLHNNKERPNLHILPMSTATKIFIDNQTKMANGVQYMKNRLKFEVRARREVILSAGPIASPQLLMLSGIGPKDHLSQHNITLVQDLPVGRTLYDHITFPGLVFTLNVTNVSLIENRETSVATVIRWLQFGDGPASTTGAAEGIGYIKTPVSEDPEPIPDIELISIGGSIVSDGGPGGSKAVRRGMMITEETFDGAYGSVDATDTWTAFPMLLHPKSVGYLELKNKNPLSHPKMYGNYLTDPKDVATFLEAIRFIQALAQTEPFRKLGARLHEARYPACYAMAFDSDEYWECAIRTLTATLHHQIATCRMGPNTDSLAVVDPELRVYGVSRLRVVDSSIIPRTLSVHTHAPAIMIGEKAADMIKSTWKTEDDEIEVTVETEAEDSGRNGKLLWSHHPLIDIIKQTSRNLKETGDFFDFMRDSYKLPNGLKAPLPFYDFIVVGAGSAGSVLASRLSENRNTTVLLLEAGKPEMLLTDIPGMAAYFQATDYTWQYYMEPQPGVCMGMINERCFWPRGKAVGGSSVINYMIYTRGRPHDWDRIAADGNYGWSYNDVLKYYMKSERANLHGLENQPYRSKTGDMPITFVPKRTKLVKAFLEAGRILGHPTVDYNSPHELGFGYVQANIDKGHRQSAAKVFLHPHKRRKNLHIMPSSTASKVLIHPQTKTAYGVEFIHKGVKYISRVRKEVIVSAGPIASPQLLMLSGVGPSDHLTSLGIPVIKNLPVGQTLYDHISFPAAIFTLNSTRLSFNEARALKVRSILFDWLRDGDNELSSPGAVEGIGYIKTPVSDDPEPVPDIELISVGGSIVIDGGPDGSRAVRRGMKIAESVFNQALGPVDNTDTWSALPMLLYPKSFGYLKLKDKNAFSHPLMYGNYLTDPRDVATLVASIRHIQALAATKPFQKFGARMHKADYPRCRDKAFDSDAYWECAVRTITATLHHQIATCRMGPAGDPKAVVDPELRVFGIKNLRVVDSSVIPRPISAHTHAPAVMIGEKAADMIKYTWSIS